MVRPNFVFYFDNTNTKKKIQVEQVWAIATRRIREMKNLLCRATSMGLGLLGPH